MITTRARARCLSLAASLLVACGGGAQEPPGGTSRLVLGAECPPGSAWDGSRCAPKPLPSVAAQGICPDGSAPDRGECPPASATEDPSEGAEIPPRPPLYSTRDLRSHAHKQRGASLLKVEIQQLKALLELTPRDSPDRPHVLRRLAEVHAELAWAAPKGARSARTSAIQYYEMLHSDHRTFCASPPSTRCDEVLYYIGLENELLGDMDKARRSYLSLVRDHPQSPLVPYAYFAFGEYFFMESKSDPSKLPLAEQVYEKVLQYGDSPIAPEAMSRLAEIAEAQGDAAKAQKYRARGAMKIPSSAPVEEAPPPR